MKRLVLGLFALGFVLVVVPVTWRVWWWSFDRIQGVGLFDPRTGGDPVLRTRTTPPLVDWMVVGVAGAWVAIRQRELFGGQPLAVTAMGLLLIAGAELSAGTISDGSFAALVGLGWGCFLLAVVLWGAKRRPAD